MSPSAPPRARASTVRALLAPLALPALLAAALLAGAGTRAGAQTTATFDVGVYIPAPVTVSGDRPLAMPKMVQGTNKTVPASDPSRSGQFTLTGAGCATVELTFVLPSALAGPAGATLPIDTWTGEWTGGQGGTPQGFTPSGAATRAQFDHSAQACLGTSSAASASYTDSETGVLVVRIGATVRAAANQSPTAYSSPVVLQVIYVDQ